MKQLKQTAFFNRFVILMPVDCVNDCSHQGQCDDDVEYWTPKLKLRLSPADMIEELKEYGTWDTEELSNMTDHQLKMKLVWIGANNIKEENEVKS
jgi:hypothetical protein